VPQSIAAPHSTCAIRFDVSDEIAISVPPSCQRSVRIGLCRARVGQRPLSQWTMGFPPSHQRGRKLFAQRAAENKLPAGCGMLPQHCVALPHRAGDLDFSASTSTLSPSGGYGTVADSVAVSLPARCSGVPGLHDVVGRPQVLLREVADRRYSAPSKLYWLTQL